MELDNTVKLKVGLCSETDQPKREEECNGCKLGKFTSNIRVCYLYDVQNIELNKETICPVKLAEEKNGRKN